MSGHTYYIAGDLPYHVINCDVCGKTYARYDDVCYSWNLLREAAAADGWIAGQRPKDPCNCDGCSQPAKSATSTEVAGSLKANKVRSC